MKKRFLKNFLYGVVSLFIMFIIYGYVQAATEVLSNKYPTLSECTSDKDKYNIQFPNYVRSTCFAKDGGYYYTICQKGETCNAPTPTQNDQTTAVEYTGGENPYAKSIKQSIKIKMDTIVSALETKKKKTSAIEMEIYLNNFLSKLGTLRSKYAGKKAIEDLLGYLEIETKRIKEDISLNNFLCDLAGDCNVSTSTSTNTKDVQECSFNVTPYYNLGLKTTFYYSDKKYEPNSSGVMNLPGNMKDDFYVFKGTPTNPQVYFTCNDGTLTLKDTKYQIVNPLPGVAIPGDETKFSNNNGTTSFTNNQGYVVTTDRYGTTSFTNSDGIVQTIYKGGISTFSTYMWSCIVPNNDIIVNTNGFTCDEKNLYDKEEIEGYKCSCSLNNSNIDNGNIKNNIKYIVTPSISFLGLDKKNNKMKFSVKNYNKYSLLMLHQNTTGKMVLQCYSLGVTSCMKAEKTYGDYNESIFEIKLTDFTIDEGFKKDNVIALIPSIYEISTDSNIVNLAGYYSNSPITDSDFSYTRSYDSKGQWLEWKSSPNVKSMAWKSIGPNGIRFNNSGSLNLSTEFLSFDTLEKYGWLSGSYDMTWTITLKDGTIKTYKEYFYIPEQ